MKRKIKIGVVGTNFVSDWLVEAAALTGDFDVTGVYSRKRETGEAFASKHGIKSVFTDYGEFLESEEIEAVYIASPNSLHFEQTMQALSSGKHVLCEKPIATSSEQLALMEKTAKEKNLVLLEAMRPAHDPAMRIIKENISKIGKVRRACFQFCQYSSRYDKYKEGIVMNAFNPKLSNAAVMDLGVYCLCYSIMLFGKPADVNVSSVFLPNGMEAQGTVLLTYDGMISEISYSKIADALTPSYIYGEDGFIEIDKLSTPSKLRIVYRDKREENLNYTPCENNMVYELNSFSDLINGEDSLLLEMQETTRITTEVLDEIRKKSGIVFN